MGKRHIDLTFDPPPDIAVEIDLTNESASTLPLYADLNVPELWRYDGTAVRFYGLTAEGYQEIAESRFLHRLTAAALTDALALSKTDGQTAALAAFRRRFQSGV